MKTKTIKKQMHKDDREFEKREFGYLTDKFERKQMIYQLAKKHCKYMRSYWNRELFEDTEEYMIDDEIYKD